MESKVTQTRTRTECLLLEVLRLCANNPPALASFLSFAKYRPNDILVNTRLAMTMMISVVLDILAYSHWFVKLHFD